MKTLRFAIFGTGFWSRYQLAGWRELQGAECVALYNRTRSKAEALAQQFGIPAVYDDPEQLLQNEQVDFIDIITDVNTHAQFVLLAARYRKAVICQKPMAPDLATARHMVQVCREAGVPFFIHENWRWQTPLREAKRVLQSGAIGQPFRARVTFSNSFPVFDNQPFLRELEQFILTDIGSHILDTARFLFGEAQSLYCQIRRVNPTIRGEDVATVMMRMGEGTTVVCEMSYASRTEHERFPQTFLFVEGEKGSLELATDYWLRVTTEEGTLSRRVPPPRYSWADPAYDVVHASIVPCNADLLRALQTGGLPETHAEDNLRTMELVFASYESAQQDKVIHLEEWRRGG
ncbi:MAG: Gfo/Idh/MocA family oxidoreductase [Armatimonadetes bacterium]|nr:Gfo/Idh/MocA family oxidoreductase [Armatimonadota bacterium]